MKKLLAIAIASFVFAGTANAIEVSTITSNINGTIKSVGSSVTYATEGKVGSKSIELNNGLASALEFYSEGSSSVTNTKSKSSGTFHGGTRIHKVGNTTVGNSWENQYISGVNKSKTVGSSYSSVVGTEISVSANGEVSDNNSYSSFESSAFNERTRVDFNQVTKTRTHFAE